MTNFAGFFESLWKSGKWPKPEPFPWQTMLAQRGALGDWPEAINLPTASGKTACLDAAVFALAATANAAREERMPRRIWFVVDRRIVVDEAFERARNIAAKLANPAEDAVKEVAAGLRTIGGSDPERPPLAVARLRGGAWRDDGWARVPSQPAIICSTVDQVGSALLFRAYGHSDRTASIYAGLAANDSLILLDEAHCAVPFLQTLRSIARFRTGPWAKQALRMPFRFSVMSATPPADIREDATFPRPEDRAAALSHAVLQKRFTARKLAELVPVKGDEEEFVAQAVKRARNFAEEEGKQGKRRVAIMVNRVATAEEIATGLRKESANSVDVVLLTGRMRPVDRDDLVERWASKLKAGSDEILPKPVIVVTTQCLEVGADFSFDALVTECASLDALRQRFGRLDRFGDLRESGAAILIRERDTKEPKDGDGDPIYERATYETWRWLGDAEQRNGDGAVDFGIEAMDARVTALRQIDEQHFHRLLAPARDAPVLLPAHLDLLCQTSPRPDPEPDTGLFLHGKDRGAPEVRVVFRADLPDVASDRQEEAAWLDILSLVPPTSPEALTVPLYRLRRWLCEGPTGDTSSDVEGAPEAADERGGPSPEGPLVPLLIWRGRERSQRSLQHLRPNDVVVLRLTKDGLSGLGQIVAGPCGLGPGQLDLAERALRQARGRVVLRVQRDVLAPIRELSSVERLLGVVSEPEPDRAEIKAALQAALDETAATKEAKDETATPSLADWLKEAIGLLIKDGFRMEHHPAGGLILVGRKNRPVSEAAGVEDDPLADDEDLRCKGEKPVTLAAHTAVVNRVTCESVARCLPPEFREAFSDAAYTHDLGKLDRRFQILLRDGAEEQAEQEPPLAKSESLPERWRRRAEIREDVQLPEGFRHEFLSMQLAEHQRLVPTDPVAGDLTLHLVASHHGHARPFAPVVQDPLLEEGKADDLSLSQFGVTATVTVAERKALPPAYRLDSGVPERFWRLTRHHGWWGLAYLEAIFRLADWEASRSPLTDTEEPLLISPSRQPSNSRPVNRIALDALDGANPLAFLAALGALRVLSRSFPQHQLRLGWSQRLGAWRPVLSAVEPLDEEAVVTALYESGIRLDGMFSGQLLAASEAASPKNKKGEARWKDKLLFPIGDLREFCRAAAGSPSTLAEFSTAWAGETASSDQEGEKLACRTRFDFTAGQQAFIRMLRELRESCTPTNLRESLFTGWRYSPAAVSMRWDTEDEKRQYALQAVDPTNVENPPLADLGANFLAVEALPLFPLVPDWRASQPGFDRDANGRSWRWPIWTCSIGLDAIRSLLTLPLADSDEWPPPRRRALGISTVFRSGIVQPSGRYRCFAPAQSF
jgi:CRISPR-associated endonuclease/helicase Cas3